MAKTLAKSGTRLPIHHLVGELKSLISTKSKGAGGVVLSRTRYQDVGIWTTEVRVAGTAGIYSATWTSDQPIPLGPRALVKAVIAADECEPWASLSEEELEEAVSLARRARSLPADDSDAISKSISKCRSLRGLARRLQSLRDETDISSLDIPSFGDEDPSGHYAELLEGAGYQSLSWDEEKTLFAVDGELKLMSPEEVHGTLCGASCPYCKTINCVDVDHVDTGTCHHYIGQYDPVNCELQWWDSDIERLFEGAPRSEPFGGNPCKIAQDFLELVLGEVAYAVTTNECQATNSYSTGIPLFFASNKALRALERLRK